MLCITIRYEAAIRLAAHCPVGCATHGVCYWQVQEVFLEDAGVSCRHHPWWLAPYYLRRGCRVFSCLISSPTVFLLTFDAYIYSYLGYLSSSRHFCHADFLTFPLSSSSLMMLRLYMTLKDTSD